MELSRFGARSRAARADGGGDGGRAATVSWLPTDPLSTLYSFWGECISAPHGDGLRRVA